MWLTEKKTNEHAKVHNMHKREGPDARTCLVDVYIRCTVSTSSKQNGLQSHDQHREMTH